MRNTKLDKKIYKESYLYVPLGWGDKKWKIFLSELNNNNYHKGTNLGRVKFWNQDP